MRTSKGRRTPYTWLSLQEKARVLTLARERTGSDEFQGLVTEALKLWEGTNLGPRLPEGLPADLNDEEVTVLAVVLRLLRSKGGSSVRQIVSALNELR